MVVCATDYVDGFHDVYLAICGPVGGIGEPEGGPGRAAGGCVLDVEDEEVVESVLRFGGDAHRVAAGGGVRRAGAVDGGVDAHHCGGGGGVCEV